MNKFLKRTLFGSVAAGMGLVIVTTLAVRSAYEAERQKQNAELSEINALNNFSEVFFASNQYPDALLKALRAGDKLKRTDWKQEVSNTKIQTTATLRQTVYLKQNAKKKNRSFELNTLEGHSSAVYSVAYSPNGNTNSRKI